MATGRYLFIFILSLANLFGFVRILQMLSMETAIVQIFVIFAYLVISAMVLWGIENVRGWSMASGAVLFLAQLINVAVLYTMMSSWVLLIVALIALVGFLYSIVNVDTRRRLAPAVVPVSEERVVLEPYGPKKVAAVKRSARRTQRKTKAATKRKSSKPKSAAKKAPKRKSTRAKKTTRKTAKKKSSKRKTAKKASRRPTKRARR